jgi:hypothetical protein
MKKLIKISILALLFASEISIAAQERPKEYLGLPGDNLNLYAVMKLFQESQTLEGFEKSLNDENSRINNLDLNGDNLIDYITVKDYVDGNVHTIVLQVALNENEKQDVAVFTVQRSQDGSAQVQLVGDEALYGKNYIIEPIYGNNSGETPNPGYMGSTGNTRIAGTTTIEVSAWPLISFLFMHDYIPWRSSWFWGFYPSYWHPWRPFFWDYYYGYHYHWFPSYYSHYRHLQYNRYTHYNDFYYRGLRAYSPLVSMRVRGGNYRSTYSHPEQRRDGEALYSRTHNSQNYRTVGRPIANNYGTSRINSTQGQNAGTSRRSADITSQRSNRNFIANQSSGLTRRSADNTVQRSDRNSYPGQNNFNSRISAPSISDRAISRPETIRRNETVRASRPTAGISSSRPTAGISSSRQQYNRETRTGNSGNRSTGTGKSGKSRTSHR